LPGIATSGTLAKAVHEAPRRDAFAKQGLAAQPGTPDPFAALISRQLQENAPRIRTIGIAVN
jgi:hypothetical protein